MNSILIATVPETTWNAGITGKVVGNAIYTVIAIGCHTDVICTYASFKTLIDVCDNCIKLLILVCEELIYRCFTMQQ